MATEPAGSVNVVRGGTRAARLADERTTLLGMLQRQRDLVAWKLRDIPDQKLRSVSTASGLSAPGVVRHLGNVERVWFRQRFAGEADLSFDRTDEQPDAEFHPPADVPVSELLAAYAAEQARCDAVIMAAPRSTGSRPPATSPSDGSSRI